MKIGERQNIGGIEREDIFSQVFTIIIVKSSVQNIQTKTEMGPHDQY